MAKVEKANIAVTYSSKIFKITVIYKFIQTKVIKSNIKTAKLPMHSVACIINQWQS